MTEIQTKYAAIAINTIRERQTDTCRKQGQRNVDNSNITYYNIINPSPRNLLRGKPILVSKESSILDKFQLDANYGAKIKWVVRTHV